MRVFGRSATSAELPERCPACGHDVRIHGRRERFPSTYMGRISRTLHQTPPLQV